MLCKLPLFSFDYLCKSPKLGFTLTSTAKVGIYFNISKKTLILARSVCCWVSRWSKINLCSLLLFSPQVWPIYNLYYTASDQRYHCWRQSSNIQTKEKFQRCHFSCVFHRNVNVSSSIKTFPLCKCPNLSAVVILVVKPNAIFHPNPIFHGYFKHMDGNLKRLCEQEYEQWPESEIWNRNQYEILDTKTSRLFFPGLWTKWKFSASLNHNLWILKLEKLLEGDLISTCLISTLHANAEQRLSKVTSS